MMFLIEKLQGQDLDKIIFIHTKVQDNWYKELYHGEIGYVPYCLLGTKVLDVYEDTDSFIRLEVK